MLLKNLQDLVKIEKPMVKREGNTVVTCYFYESTNQCFGRRCFWVKYGNCPFFKP